MRSEGGDMRIDLGLIFSTTGPYRALGRAALAGARMAVDEVRDEGRLDLRPVIRDPAGVPAQYEAMSAELLSQGRVRHMIGAITSWSRKDMIPVLERHGGLLWYPCPYEGFESSDHVIYLGTSPNQHMVPLLDRMIQTGMRRVYLAGSNYVWGWETLRLARERAGQAGAEIAAERYLPLGDTDCALLIEEVGRTRPDVIVNSLIGPSNVMFMRALAELRRRDPSLRVTVVSCNQTEADLPEIGSAAEGMLSMGSWFQEAGPQDFLRHASAREPGERFSAFFATSYTAVRLVADAALRAGTDDIRAVFAAAAGRRHDTVLGPLTIDPLTRHAALTPRLARAESGMFRMIWSADGPVAADPYLTRLPAAATASPPPRPALRVVE